VVRLHQVVHAPADVMRWFGYLADLVGDGTDLAWWRLARTTGSPTAVSRWLFGAITAVVATAGLVTIGSWLIPEGSSLGGVMFGVSTGMGAGYAADRWATSEPGHVRQRMTDLAGLLGAVGSTAAVHLSAAVPTGSSPCSACWSSACSSALGCRSRSPSSTGSSRASPSGLSRHWGQLSPVGSSRVTTTPGSRTSPRWGPCPAADCCRGS